MHSLRASSSWGSTTSDHVIDNETGVIRWVVEIPIEPGEPEIFNYSAKMCDSAKYLPVGCYDSNGGAGLTREAAYRAAVGEAIERYCCSAFFPDDLILASYDELRSRHRPLHPSEVALFHPEQRNNIRYAWFTEDTRICWTQGYSLTRREPILIPACLVYIPYFPFFRNQGEETIASSISTGQASAFSPGAAVLSGIYEIVERDGFMISWLNRLPIPRIAIDSSPRVLQVFEQRLARDYLTYTLFNMTTDLGIPAVLCMIVDHSGDVPLICFGGAANLDPEQAAIKALVEAVQTRSWAKFMGARDYPFIIESDYSNIDDFEKHVFLYAYGDMLHAVDFLVTSPAEIRFADIPNRSTGTVVGDLRIAVAAIESNGYEIMAVDLTTSDVAKCGYSAVKMLIPQLHPMEGDHTHRYLGGTRLYDVPHKLGYPIASTFATLNQYPHPYP